MPALIRGEVAKLAGLRVSWVLLLIPLPLLVAAPYGVVRSGQDPSEAATQYAAYAHLGLAALLPLVLGLLAVAGEHRHGTIVDAYLVSPRRGRLLVAKLAVYGALGALAGVGYAVVLAGATAAAWPGRLPLTAADTVGALAGGLAWIALVEGVLGQLLGDGLSRWLPLAADRALGADSSAGLLPQWGGGLVLLGYAAVLVAAATVATRTRDVS
jgi:ABC-2 type transport system permease protein